MPPKRIDKSKYSKVVTGEFKPVTPKMREVGFIRLRTGIFDHTTSGKITPYDLAVYLTMLKFANWRTGICVTTAASIASNWGDWGSLAEKEGESDETKAKRKKRTIQNCLRKLRERGYIKYREGDGKRGSYAVLIDKYEPPLGALLGWSLDVAATEDLDNPVYRYVSPTSFHDVYGEKYEAQHMGACAVNVQSTVQSVCAATYGQCAVNGTVGCTVRVPFQDVLKMYQEVFKTSQEPQEMEDGRTSVRPSVGGREENCQHTNIDHEGYCPDCNGWFISDEEDFLDESLPV